jgi:hypothetical protein
MTDRWDAQSLREAYRQEGQPQDLQLDRLPRPIFDTMRTHDQAAQEWIRYASLLR